MSYEHQSNKSVTRLVRIDYIAYFIIFICLILGVPVAMIQTGNQEILYSFVSEIYNFISLNCPWWIFLGFATISFLFSLLA